MEKIIFTILSDGSYGPRPMTDEELQTHEELIQTSVELAESPIKTNE